MVSEAEFSKEDKGRSFYRFAKNESAEQPEQYSIILKIWHFSGLEFKQCDLMYLRHN